MGEWNAEADIGIDSVEWQLSTHVGHRAATRLIPWTGLCRGAPARRLRNKPTKGSLVLKIIDMAKQLEGG